MTHDARGGGIEGSSFVRMYDVWPVILQRVWFHHLYACAHHVRMACPPLGCRRVLGMYRSPKSTEPFLPHLAISTSSEHTPVRLVVISATQFEDNLRSENRAEGETITRSTNAGDESLRLILDLLG